MLQGLATNLARYVAGARRRAILLLFATGFGIVYIPLVISTVLFGYYPHTIDTITVLVSLVLATTLCAWIVWLSVPWYQSTPPERRRENLGWGLIALNGLVVLVARLLYAIEELLRGGTSTSIGFADALLGTSFIFLFLGVLTFPWTSGQDGGHGWLLDVGIVVVAVVSVLWPLLVGPVLDGNYGDEVSLWSMVAYLVAAFVLFTSALWRVMRGVRPELWTVAILLSLGVIALVMTLVGFFAVSVSGYGAGDPLFFTNAMTSLGYILISMAAVLRLQVTSEQAAEEEHEVTTVESPVHRWQIILPLPLAGGILCLIILLDLLGWRTGYLTATVVGLGIVLTLLAYRQMQLVHYNERLYQRVAGAAIRDGLTQLYNHRAMQEILRKQAAQTDRTGQSLAVIFLDIDRFKKYNDTYGHRQGDGLLTSIAELLLRECRASDYVGRYGGEEFMIVAPDATPDTACALAERLRDRIEGTQYVHNGTASVVTISVGIALYPDDGDDPDEVLERADVAMYRAKASGRNQAVLYSPA